MFEKFEKFYHENRWLDKIFNPKVSLAFCGSCAVLNLFAGNPGWALIMCGMAVLHIWTDRKHEKLMGQIEASNNLGQTVGNMMKDAVQEVVSNPNANAVKIGNQVYRDINMQLSEFNEEHGTHFYIDLENVRHMIETAVDVRESHDGDISDLKVGIESKLNIK